MGIQVKQTEGQMVLSNSTVKIIYDVTKGTAKERAESL